ncbi:hypothetical protein Leryth_002410 [Lithospermum erythrorhizon]|nr:hypothetical protein Leryth_002410 [Lithospermum erythrorhizon]
MLAVLDTNILWVNPDCGLKTRKFEQSWEVPSEQAEYIGVTGFGFDVVRGNKTLDLIKSGFPSGKYLFAGVVDGRNIWANDLASSLSTLQTLEGITSLLSQPHDPFSTLLSILSMKLSWTPRSNPGLHLPPRKLLK